MSFHHRGVSLMSMGKHKICCQQFKVLKFWFGSHLHNLLHSPTKLQQNFHFFAFRICFFPNPKKSTIVYAERLTIQTPLWTEQIHTKPSEQKCPNPKRSTWRALEECFLCELRKVKQNTQIVNVPVPIQKSLREEPERVVCLWTEKMVITLWIEKSY